MNEDYEGPVYIDIERMEKALKSPRYTLPPGLKTCEEIIQFINSVAEQES